MKLTLAACVAGLSGSMVLRHLNLSERASLTVREIALNHVSELSIEFNASCIGELNERMVLLPFSAALPDRLDQSVNVLGARYCTVRGNLAVHVKLVDKMSQQSLSTFITPVLNDLESIDNITNTIDGVDVELWQENGLFYTMAH